MYLDLFDVKQLPTRTFYDILSFWFLFKIIPLVDLLSKVVDQHNQYVPCDHKNKIINLFSKILSWLSHSMLISSKKTKI
jgi:hypothetical protein